MPVTINPTDVKFFRQLINGVAYTDNPGEFTPNLVGNCFHRVKLTQKINIEWALYGTSGNPITRNTTQDYLEIASGSWIEEGFSIGDTFDLFKAWSTVPILEGELTINSFSADEKRAYFTLNSGAFTLTKYDDAACRGKTDLTSLFYKFGIIENDDPVSFLNTVTEGEQTYYLGDIDGTLTDMIPQGTRRDWRTGTAKVKKNSNPYTYVQQFEIEHEFRIPEFATQETITKLLNDESPVIYEGESSPKYVYQVNFGTANSNPNSRKTETFDSNLGSVGWKDQNFNGLNNDYNVDSVVYYETATPANSLNGLKLGIDTTAFITISTTRTNAFSNGEPVGVIIAYLPPSDEYENTITGFDENFIIDQAYVDIGDPAVSSDFIKNFSVAINGSDIELTIEVDYSAAQQLRLDDSKYYAILVDIGDPTFSSGSSDQVLLLAEARQYVAATDIPGLFDVNSMRFFDENMIVDTNIGYTSFDGYNEEGFAVDGEFQIDLNKDAVLESLSFGILAYNSSTGDWFILNEYNVSFVAVIDGNGAQQISVNTTRGYNLIAGSQFNKVFIETGTFVGGIQKYNYTFGQKVPWQDWEENPDVNAVFFDATKPNNNLNNKASNYSGENGYEIHFFIRAKLTGTDVIGKSGSAEVLKLSPVLKIYDYLEDPDSPARTYTPVIETFNNDNMASLGGSIVIDGADTLFRTRYTPSIAVADITDIIGWNRIEPEQSSNIDELGNVNLPPSPNLLKPVSGETYAKIYLDSGDIVVDVLIDGNLVDSSVQYSLSSEIKQIEPCGMLYEDGDTMLFETGETMIYEHC